MNKEENHGASSRGGEPGFAELNKVLEEKVNHLMADVDLILSKQMHVMRFPKQPSNKQRDDLADYSAVGLNLPNQHTRVQSDSDEMLQGFTARATSKKTSESLVRFFQGQIRKLETDLEAVQYEKKKTEDQCKYLEAQVRKKDESEGKIRHQLDHYKDGILKIESANSDMCLKVQAQSVHISSLKKEVENLKIKLTSLNQLLNNNELRLNRNIEENDKLRSSLKLSQIQEKESRDYIRKMQEEKRLALKALEKQRTEIFQAFKKQIQLIGNLKKQKLYMETNKQVQFIEKEFEKLLECKVI